MTTPLTVISARGRPPAGTVPNGDNFPPHNFYNGSYLAALGGLRVGDLMAMPLGELALHVREGTAAGSTPESAQQIFSFGLHNGLWKEPTGKLAFWSPPNHCWSGLTDWRTMPLSGFNLTPARLDGTQKPVATSGIHTHMAMAGSQRDRWAVIGEFGGGTWIMGMVSDDEWQCPSGFGKYPRFQRPAKKPSSIDEYRADQPM
ncbi:uncharacterized protein N7529_001571 [Penicillium soppii]|uniref:uncharacterized protein n=1 Tax=Penicillium soppii TaxID=69789 RepID=UPI0025492A21|nr:uncharacterized protein N7529_001571 [Penicillium soppii]KAJ5875987.1 hypothetical protein N7529_001571 [Penicillium soppii]